jgi:hypothetical protein
VLVGLPQGVGGLPILFYLIILSIYFTYYILLYLYRFYYILLYFAIFYLIYFTLFYFTLFYIIFVYLCKARQVLVGLPQGFDGLSILSYIV